jgi:hypothetical protein
VCSFKRDPQNGASDRRPSRERHVMVDHMTPTHNLNFLDCAVIPRSVTDLTGEELRPLSGIGGRDMVVGFEGAPRRGFSTVLQAHRFQSRVARPSRSSAIV